MQNLPSVPSGEARRDGGFVGAAPKGRKIEEIEMYYRLTGSARRGNNIFCKNIRDRVAFKKKCDYNKLFSMFGTTI